MKPICLLEIGFPGEYRLISSDGVGGGPVWDQFRSAGQLCEPLFGSAGQQADCERPAPAAVPVKGFDVFQWLY